MYSVWCTGERELYDLEKDPKQINNLLSPLNELGAFAPFNSTASKSKPVLSHHLQHLLNRLDAVLLVLKRCTGEVCHNPYRELFPSSQATGGEIFKFSQILESRFDSFFKDLAKVQFDKCALGFQEELEKPDWKREWAYGSDTLVESIGGGIVFQGL